MAPSSLRRRLQTQARRLLQRFSSGGSSRTTAGPGENDASDSPSPADPLERLSPWSAKDTASDQATGPKPSLDDALLSVLLGGDGESLDLQQVLNAAVLREFLSARQLRPAGAGAPHDHSVVADAAGFFNQMTGLGSRQAGDKGQAWAVDLFRYATPQPALERLYLFNGLAQRVVNLFPDSATQKGWEVTDETAEVDVMSGEDARLGIVAKVNEAYRWARLYGAGYLLLVTDDDIPLQFRESPEAWLRQPLDLERVIRVRSLVVLSDPEVTPVKWGGDLRESTFDDAEIVRVSPAGHADGTWEVHSSRLIRFRGVKLPRSLRYLTSSRSGDASVLEVLIHALASLAAVHDAGAHLATEMSSSYLTLGPKERNDNKRTGNAEQTSALRARLKQIASVKGLLGMLVLNNGEKFDRVNVNTTGYKDLHAGARILVAALSGFPQIILYGDTPSGLNTDGRSHQQLLGLLTSAAQAHDLKNPLLQLYRVLYAAQEGPTDGEIPKRIELTFRALYEQTEEEKAKVQLVYAQIDNLYVAMGAYSAAHVARSRFGERGWRPGVLSVEDVPEDAPGFGGGRGSQAGVIDPEQVVAPMEGLVKLLTAHPGATLSPDGRLLDGDGVPLTEAQIVAALQPPPALPPQRAGEEMQDHLALPSPAAANAAWPKLVVVITLPESAVQLVETTQARISEALREVDDQVELQAPGKPHLTLLYLGPVDPVQWPEVIAQVRRVVISGEHSPVQVSGGQVTWFEPPADAAEPRTPIVIEYRRRALSALNNALLRALTPWVAADQFANFRSHLTAWYLVGLLSDEQAAALEDVRASGRWTAARVEIWSSDQRVAGPWVLPAQQSETSDPE